MPRIEDLRIFCDIVESGSFSKTAERLGVSQPSISQQIKSLETEIGAVLLHREGNKILPTQNGRIFFTSAVRIIAIFNQSKDQIKKAETIIHGDLVIGASSGPGENILPIILGQYKQRHPDVNINLRVADTDEILDLIINHRIELGFVGSTRRDAQLAFEPFFNDELVLVTSKDHSLAQRKSITSEELLDIPLILQQRGSGATSVLFDAIKERGLLPVNLKNTMELGLQESTKTAVKAGLGATVISRHAVQDELLLGEFVRINIPDLDLKRNFSICYNKTLPLTNLMNDFLFFAKQYKKNLFAPPMNNA
jgi:DNA-binding transcriptional LysR family regulator